MRDRGRKAGKGRRKDNIRKYRKKLKNLSYVHFDQR